jgi:CheY-like chemotaxis protein
MANEMKTILVVEDDNGIRDSLKALLEMEGYDVLLATNGEEALAVLKSSRRPKLILLDLMMPVMDGFKFREMQSAAPEISDIPIVIMSADGHVAPKQAQIGARDYIKKPVDIDDLLNRIAAYF